MITRPTYPTRTLREADVAPGARVVILALLRWERQRHNTRGPMGSVLQWTTRRGHTTAYVRISRVDGAARWRVEGDGRLYGAGEAREWQAAMLAAGQCLQGVTGGAA